mgnify:FL=1
MTAFATGKDVRVHLRSYNPAIGSVDTTFRHTTSGRFETESTLEPTNASDVVLHDSQTTCVSDEEEIWAAEIDEDDAPYEAVEPSVHIKTGIAWLQDHNVLSEDTPTAASQSPQAKLLHLLQSLNFTPLSLLPSAASWQRARLYASINKAVQTVIVATASGSLSSQEADQLVWPLLSLVCERLRSSSDAFDNELETAISIAGASWRNRLLVALLADDSLPWRAASSRSYCILEAAVRAELPALIHSLESSTNSTTSPHPLLALLSFFTKTPRAHGARTYQVLLDTGALQFIVRKCCTSGTDVRNAADPVEEWRWLLCVCCKHRPVLSFVARVPALFKAICSSACLRERKADRVAWLWILSVDQCRSASFARTHSQAHASHTFNDELTAKSINALRDLCDAALSSGPMNGCPDTDRQALKPDSHGPGRTPPGDGSASVLEVPSERRQVDALLFILELMGLLKQAMAGAMSPNELLFSTAASPLYERLETLGKGLGNIMKKGGAIGPPGEPLGVRTAFVKTDRGGSGKRAELFERVARALKMLHVASTAPCKND